VRAWSFAVSGGLAVQDRELFGRILGIGEPWFVEEVELKEALGELRIRLGRRSSPLCCPTCGKAVPGYDTQPRRWRHLDTCQYETVLEADVPRVECPEHGVLQVRVPWAEKGSRFTLLFERLTIDWLLEAGRSAVKRRMRLSWDEADGIMRRAVRRGLARRKQEVVPHIGVDEKSFQKRHEYVTVVCDLDRGNVLHVADDRKAESLEGYYRSLTNEQRAGIQAVAMDMHDPYVKATRDQVPDADRKIVYDKFHIAKLLNQAVDQVRKQEHQELTAEGDDRLKKTKYTWLRSSLNFTRKAWLAFRDLRRSKLRTARAWALKETIMDLWQYSYLGAAQRYFRDWYQWAARSRLAPMKRAARTLQERLANILTYLDHPYTNAMAESLNSKIQWIKYTARGFRSREGFRTAIYFHCGGLELYPQ
jgi:transposase